MDIEYVANLARLKLTNSEKVQFSKQLGDILHYIEKLDQLDTKDIEPTAHIIPIKNIWRNDEVKNSLSQDLLKRNMPEEHEGFFKVPPVVDKFP